MGNQSSTRKAGVIAFVVIALIAAAGVIYWTIKSQQPVIVQTVNAPPGSNPKIQAMKAMKAQQESQGTEKDPNAIGDK